MIFRLAEGSITQKTIDEIKEHFSGNREEVRKEVREAAQQSKSLRISVYKKYICTEKLDRSITSNMEIDFHDRLIDLKLGYDYLILVINISIFKNKFL